MTEQDELERVRARVHNLSDRVQAHDITLAELRLDQTRTRSDVALLTQSAVSKDNVELILKPITDQIEAMGKAIEKIESHIVWGTRLVVGMVGAALIALVLRT